MAIAADTPLYNSRIINLFLKLLADKYPHLDSGELLNHCGMKRWEVADPGHWFSQRQIDLFSDKLVQMSKDPGIAREAGRYAASPDGLGALQAFVMGLIGPEYAFSVANKVAWKLTHSSRMSTRKTGPRELEVTVHFQPGVRENPFQCQNRIGFFEAIFLMYGHDFPQIRHTDCIFEGDEVCRYLISWTPSLASWLVLLRKLSYLLLPLSAAFLFIGSGSFFAPIFISILTLCLMSTLLVCDQERKALFSSLTNMRNSTEKLLAEAQDNCDNARTINEIGKVLATRTELSDILANVNEVLRKELHYGRGIILLLDQEREALSLKGSFGFSDEQQARLERMVLPIGDAEPHGVLVRCFLTQEPVLVNDLTEVRGRANAEAYSFFLQVGVKSFICAPIVCEGESLGVFAVDDMKREGELLERDLNLVQGVAPVIGTAIRNATRLANERRLSEQLRKASEQLERRVAERTSELSQAYAELEFLYDSVSHDLRTPLRVIYGYGELLMEGYGDKLDHTAREYLANIVNGGERMEQTLDRMLDLSEARLTVPALQPVDLSAMAQRILTDLRITDPSRDVSVDIEEGVVVEGDEKMLTSVMENLLGNAWKYSGAKPVTRIAFGRRDGACYVEDNGEGFDMSQVGKLFLPFQKLHDGTQFAGHGLGLCVVQHMLARMGGTVWGEGKAGEGATFYFTIPTRESA